MIHKRGDFLVKSQSALSGGYYRWMVKVMAFAGRGKKKLWVKHVSVSGDVVVPLQLTMVDPREFRRAHEVEVAAAITRIISK